ncbi:nicotianamine synthase-like [Senna tora]|uniref:Nicotianamine synthase n=1 Tax=Senna tora TaxID=362788 RepID=A0A834THX0_9FABA|nr:nicotianamine synthase-like [Senna tora]
MASFQNLNLETQISENLLITQITQLHASISKLESLKPSKQVNSLFTQLVKLCILPSSIDIQALPQEVKNMRESLINLCGQAEGLMELEFSTFLAQIPKPLNNLTLFPYYGNYVKLANMEHRILKENGVVHPKKVAFVGSGPMPLTSIIMATHHLVSTHFDNYDIDEKANEAARRIVATVTESELEKRMKFETKDIMEVREKLGEYDCIFLAALVGMSRDAKVKILGHLRKYMKEGGVLLVRSAKGARAFLYPIVEEHDLVDFEVLTIFHPTNNVINSVVLLRKPMI